MDRLPIFLLPTGILNHLMLIWVLLNRSEVSQGKWRWINEIIWLLQLKQSEPVTTWIAVSEDSVTLLELQTMSVMRRYNYTNIITFGGCLDDFMLVACPDEGAAEQKLLFVLSKPKVRSSYICIMIRLIIIFFFFFFFFFFYKLF